MSTSTDNVEQPKRTGLADYSAASCGKHVTVYCWSRSTEGSERYVTAHRLGALLAQRGFGVVTGGYCGSMEAVSRGARETAPAAPTSPALPVAALPTGAGLAFVAAPPAQAGLPPAEQSVTVRGVLVPGQFPDRVLCGNAYLTESVDSKNMLHRLDLLSSLTRYYVILPGTLGTLAELVVIWQQSALQQRGLDRPVILAWRDPWQAIVEFCVERLGIQADFAEAIRFVDSPEHAVGIIEADYLACTAPSSAAQGSA
jgi:uncharacterized protein (TIGR00730 family)